MRNLGNFIKSIIKACPYSIAGKKCIEVVKGNKLADTKKESKTQRFKEGIKTGRNISLIGVFCPFLWYSIVSGASKNFIILNLIHSAIIVGIGILIIISYYLALLNYRKKTEK